MAEEVKGQKAKSQRRTLLDSLFMLVVEVLTLGY